MLSEGWNTVEIRAEERPTVQPEDLRAMLDELDPDDFDEPVQEFMREVERGGDAETLRRAATLLLQDEVDFSPEIRAAGVEPEEKLIALLLAAGADANARNAYGELPLHLAVRYGYPEIVRMLLAAGARQDLRNARGELAVSLATMPEIIDLLAERESLGEGEGSTCDCHHYGEEHECRCGHRHEEGHTCDCDEGKGHCCHHHEH